MKNYEVLTVFKPNLDAEEVDNNLKKLEKNIQDFKGNIVKTDKMGRKKLAYDIQNFRDGFFVNQIIELPEEKVADYRRVLKLEDSVLRVMFLDVSKKFAVK